MSSKLLVFCFVVIVLFKLSFFFRYESSGRNAHIEFKTDSHVEKGGFRLEFEFFETDPQDVRKDCVYHLTEPEAFVSSESMYKEFPLIPLFGIDCTWIIYRPRDNIGLVKNCSKLLYKFSEYKLKIVKMIKF